MQLECNEIIKRLKLKEPIIDISIDYIAYNGHNINMTIENCNNEYVFVVSGKHSVIIKMIKKLGLDDKKFEHGISYWFEYRYFGQCLTIV
jgi:hypothetical protein